jgi:hypothetical protein
MGSETPKFVTQALGRGIGRNVVFWPSFSGKFIHSVTERYTIAKKIMTVIK